MVMRLFLALIPTYSHPNHVLQYISFLSFGVDTGGVRLGFSFCLHSESGYPDANVRCATLADVYTKAAILLNQER